MDAIKVFLTVHVVLSKAASKTLLQLNMKIVARERSIVFARINSTSLLNEKVQYGSDIFEITGVGNVLKMTLNIDDEG